MHTDWVLSCLLCHQACNIHIYVIYKAHKIQNENISRLVLHLYLLNPLKPCFKSRMINKLIAYYDAAYIICLTLVIYLHIYTHTHTHTHIYIYISISFKIASLATGQSYDSTSARVVNLKDICKCIKLNYCNASMNCRINVCTTFLRDYWMTVKSYAYVSAYILSI